LLLTHLDPDGTDAPAVHLTHSCPRPGREHPEFVRRPTAGTSGSPKRSWTTTTSSERAHRRTSSTTTRQAIGCFRKALELNPRNRFARARSSSSARSAAARRSSCASSSRRWTSTRATCRAPRPRPVLLEYGPSPPRGSRQTRSWRSPPRAEGAPGQGESHMKRRSSRRRRGSSRPPRDRAGAVFRHRGRRTLPQRRRPERSVPQSVPSGAAEAAQERRARLVPAEAARVLFRVRGFGRGGRGRGGVAGAVHRERGRAAELLRAERPLRGGGRSREGQGVPRAAQKLNLSAKYIVTADD